VGELFFHQGRRQGGPREGPVQGGMSRGARGSMFWGTKLGSGGSRRRNLGTGAQLNDLPTLNRNPYALVALSGNVSDPGAGNRGVGYAINGLRESGTNILLDGAANNDEFTASVGQRSTQLPQPVQASRMTL